MINQILEIVGLIFIVIGSIFLFLGALGIFRMPDVFNRLQAGTKATTLGGMSFVIGIGLIQPDWFWKTFIIVIFILLSNPISSHALARSSYKSKIKPFFKGNPEEMDAYKDVVENQSSDSEY